jgi:predicted type IV restriction endonuclease
MKGNHTSDDDQIPLNNKMSLTSYKSTEDESKLTEIALKSLRKEQIKDLIERAKEIIEKKNEF